MARFSPLSLDRWRFWFDRLQEKLWIRPLALCLLSIVGAFVAKLADGTGLAELVPKVAEGSVESLLSVMASSMLTIATLAVGSMVAAYASASTSATPRSIPLVISDDVTQNALSAFLGAFIFSLISLVSVKNSFYGEAGLFTMFVLTLWVFALVVVTFVRWVDRIARLGRLGNTIAQVEEATRRALERRRRAPTLCGLDETPGEPQGLPLYSTEVGYVQHISVATLQNEAVEREARVTLMVLPGTFVCTERPMAFIEGVAQEDLAEFARAFTLGRNRTFEDDPRFGLVALSEIADKALSPGINDPGTAIDVINTMVRLLTLWIKPPEDETPLETAYDRVVVPKLNVDDMLDDAFTAIARDGAGMVEVGVRLQKAFRSLEALNNQAMSRAARRHAQLALERAERALTQAEDKAVVRANACLGTRTSD
ncbi:DUF2254 domain-containing protein [Marinimicrobium sp. ARAG 43.8]|uniref:DUF2254 domain-containing protein n=1 Tax=Marinimicrobium sp. ARAG 43.8 TaxID=3418719 RepID=UPI003CF83FDB